MGTTLRISHQTNKEHRRNTHLLYIILFFLCAPICAQQDDLCSKLPQARFSFSHISDATYLNIETLNFPESSEANPDPLKNEYYIVIESEDGDYNNQWGPFTGPSPNVFSTDFGPLESTSKNFKFSFQGSDDSSEDCPKSSTFSLHPDDLVLGENNFEDEQLEDWDKLFDHIDNFEFEKAIAETRTKRSFTAEDAALYEFANFSIERAQKDQFEVYFKVYPNPAEDVVFIQNIETNEHQLSLVIMDLNGDVKMKKLFEVEKYNKVRMNIHRLKTGTYIIAIMNKNGRLIGMKHLYKL